MHRLSIIFVCSLDGMCGLNSEWIAGDRGNAHERVVAAQRFELRRTLRRVARLAGV